METWARGTELQGFHRAHKRNQQDPSQLPGLSQVNQSCQSSGEERDVLRVVHRQTDRQQSSFLVTNLLE